MTYIVEALAWGHEGAVKLSVLTPEEPTANERQDLASRASGQYRVQYQEWCAEVPTITVKAK